MFNGNPKTIFVLGSVSKDAIRMFEGSLKQTLLELSESMHDTLSISLFAPKGVNTYGGTGANICYTLGLLGAQPRLLAGVGRDAQHYLSQLKKIGVNIDHVHLSNLATAEYSALVDKSGAQFGFFWPGAMTDDTSLSTQSIPVDQSTFIFISPYTEPVMDRIVQECVDSQIPFAYDPGQQIIQVTPEQLRAGISQATLVFSNQSELSQIADKLNSSTEDVTALAETYILTKGALGCTIFTDHGKSTVDIPAITTAAVVDPTGAGDAFRAGFIYGYLQNLPLHICGEYGVICGALAVQQAGAQGHECSADQVLQLHSQYFQASQ